MTIPGLILAAIGQGLAVAVIGRGYRLPRRALPRLVPHLLVGDVCVALLMLGLMAGSRYVNHGPREWRVLVIGVHLSLAAVLPGAVWAMVLRRAVGRRVLRGSLLVLGLTALGLTLPGVRTSWSGRPAEVTQARLLLPRLPQKLEGLRVVVVGDLHLGERVSLAEARARLRPLRDLQADLVLFTGDLTGDTERGISEGAALLDEFAPHVPRLAVLGNHDRRTHVRLSREELREHGFTLLVNQAARVRVRGTELWIAGTNDPKDNHDKPEEALRGLPPTAFALLLAHGPDIILRPRAQQADLIVVGHTHGGQINLPLIGPLACSTDVGPRAASGVRHVGSSTLFVTRGVGDGGLPLRVYSEPEIAVVELRRG